MYQGTQIKKLSRTGRVKKEDNFNLDVITDSDFHEELERRKKKTKIIEVDGTLLNSGVIPDDSNSTTLSEKKVNFHVDRDDSVNWDDPEHIRAVEYLKKRIGSFQWDRSSLEQASIILSSGVSSEVGKKYTRGQVYSFLELNLDDQGSVKTFPKEKKIPDLSKAIKDPRFKNEQVDEGVEYLLMPEDKILIVSEDSVRCELFGNELEECKKIKCPHISITLQQGKKGPLEENSIYTVVCPVMEDELSTQCPNYKEEDNIYKGKYKKMYEAFLEIMSEEQAQLAVQKVIEKEFME